MIDWKPIYLEALRRVPVISRACEAAGIARTTAWRALQTDKDFALAHEDAMEQGIDSAEAELFRRAVQGFDEPVIDKGKLAYLCEPALDDEGSVQFDDRGNVKMKLVRDERNMPVPLTVKKHSDYLLGLFVKGRRKKVYAERIEQTGADGAPLIPEGGVDRAARAAQILEVARQRKEQDFSDLC